MCRNACYTSALTTKSRSLSQMRPDVMWGGGKHARRLNNAARTSSLLALLLFALFKGNPLCSVRVRPSLLRSRTARQARAMFRPRCAATTTAPHPSLDSLGVVMAPPSTRANWIAAHSISAPKRRLKLSLRRPRRYASGAVDATREISAARYETREAALDAEGKDSSIVPQRRRCAGP